MSRPERREIFDGEMEKAHCGPEATRMFRMRWLLEVFLQVNETAGGLDQSLKEIRIAAAGFEPELLEHVMRFVVTLFIPALEKPAIIRMICHGRARVPCTIDSLWSETLNEL